MAGTALETSKVWTEYWKHALRSAEAKTPIHIHLNEISSVWRLECDALIDQILERAPNLITDARRFAAGVVIPLDESNQLDLDPPVALSRAIEQYAMTAYEPPALWVHLRDEPVKASPFTDFVEEYVTRLPDVFLTSHSEKWVAIYTVVRWSSEDVTYDRCVSLRTRWHDSDES